jgi:hypothetical protein
MFKKFNGMKGFHIALFSFLSLFFANAQSYDKEFSIYSDSTTFSNSGTSVDFIRSMPDTGFLIISCLPKSDPFSFLQCWFANLNIQTNPYIMARVSSDVPVDLQIVGGYVASGGSVDFGKQSLTGGGKFDTVFYKAVVTKNLEQLLMNVSSQPCVLTFDWFRMGLAANPIQANVNLMPKVLPSKACTLKVANVSYFYEKADPVSKLICTASTVSSHISNIVIGENASDKSFLITFNTDSAPKNTIAFMTITLKDVGNNYTRKYDLAITITDVISPCSKPVPVADDVVVCAGNTAELSASGGVNYRWYHVSSGGTIIGTDSSYTTPIINSNTVYYVANFDSCESIRKAVDVTVQDSLLPKINALINNHFLCNSASEQLSATPSGGTFSGNGVELGYFVPTQSKINHINTIYYTLGDSVSGCHGKDSLHVFVFPCTGMENNSENGLRIYPNPTNGIFTIETDNIDDEMTIQVYDRTGRLMLEEKKSGIFNYSGSFDLSAFPVGIYMVKAIMKGKVISSKIIINPL